MNARQIGGDQVDSSTALEATRLVKNTSGRLYDAVVTNDSGGTLYFQLHDKASALVGAEVPVAWMPVLTQTTAYFSYGGGRPFRNGIVVALSSTKATYTAAASGWFDSVFI